LSKAAKRARVDRRTHYNWLKDDVWYVRAFRQAVIEAGDSLQDKLTEMAFEGNITAAIFLLKGLKPELLDKIANRMIEQALDGNPRAIAEAQRLLEAGEKPTIEDCMRVVEEPWK
jgi:hypothetical protein